MLNLWEIIGGIILIILGIIIVIVVTLQESKQEGMSGAVSGGGSDSYFGKNKPKTQEAILSRITKILSVVFFVLTVAVIISAEVFK